MTNQDPEPPLPRDKDQILRDFTVARQLKDIRDTAQIKENLSPKWWEAGVGVLQFATALGLLASIVQYPSLRTMPLGRLMVFWMVLMILSLILGFEFLILRLHHLRRAFNVNARILDDLAGRLKDLEAAHADRDAAASIERQPEARL